MSKYQHFAKEIKAKDPSITNAELGAAVKARIALEDPAPTPYETHGLPDPTGINITDTIRDKAADIINQGAPNLMIQYVRRCKPKVAAVLIDVNDGKVAHKIMRGAPIGVLVAFKDNHEILIGYSKYNFATDDADVRLEKLLFNKRDAINTAILRALTDTINKSSIPYKVAVDLPAFMSRIAKYFGGKPTNMAGTTTLYQA